MAISKRCAAVGCPLVFALMCWAGPCEAAFADDAAQPIVPLLGAAAESAVDEPGLLERAPAGDTVAVDAHGDAAHVPAPMSGSDTGADAAVAPAAPDAGSVSGTSASSDASLTDRDADSAEGEGTSPAVEPSAPAAPRGPAPGWHDAGGKRSYVFADGRVATGFCSIEGLWYYFDPADMAHPALTGVFKPAGSELSYIAGADGALLLGEVVLPDGTRAWAGPHGELYSGWHVNNGAWSYLDPAEEAHPALTGSFTAGGSAHWADDTGQVAVSTWTGDANGSWADSHARLSGASKLLENGERVVLDEHGNPRTGWFTLGESLFFGDPERAGALARGWLDRDGGRYYLDPATGSALRGWARLKEGGSWYRFDPVTGRMATGWLDLDGRRYWLGSDGVMSSGWDEVDGAWRYFGSEDDGAMHTGWLFWDDGWFYLDPDDGALWDGWQTVNGSTYYFKPAPSGRMISGEYWVDGAWRYFDDEGVYLEEQSRMSELAQGQYSSTGWLVVIDTRVNQLALFTGSHNDWHLDRWWPCSTGAPGTPTITGTYRMGIKLYSFGVGFKCYYASQILGDYLIHSGTYYDDGRLMDNRMGMYISHGCVRLDIANARYIYNEVPSGTTIRIY